MRTHLEFKSDLFPPIPGEDEETNPGIFGRALAEFLADQFALAGYGTNKPAAEDWGWYVRLQHPNFSLWIGCSSYEVPPNWLIQLHPDKAFVRRWFKKIDTQPTVAGVAATLETILLTAGEARDLRWWTDKESRR